MPSNVMDNSSDKSYSSQNRKFQQVPKQVVSQGSASQSDERFLKARGGRGPQRTVCGLSRNGIKRYIPKFEN